MEDAVGYDWEERTLQFHSGSGRAGGSGTVFHGQGAGKDDSREEIERFFRAVDAGLGTLLGGRSAPLVLAAVKYLHPIFQSISKHPNLLKLGIDGNPDTASPDELRQHGWDLVKSRFSEARTAAANRFFELNGTGRASANLAEVLAAAHDGRIDTRTGSSRSRRWSLRRSGTAPA